jgi:hypothetical protein
MFKPLIDKPRTVSFTGNFSPDLEIRGVARCASAEHAAQVASTAQAAIQLARNMLAEQLESDVREGTPQAMIAGTLEMADRFLRQAKVEAEGSEVRLSVAGGSLGQQLIQMGFVLPAIGQARESARRTQSMNNLKQIALAMHNYADTHGHFPPAAVTGPDGRTKHSWRVALLPYLEQDALYRQYDQNQPWDSENNKRVLESMPAVFRSPTEPEGTTTSAYYVPTGSKTIFPPAGNGVGFAEILDGTSNTLLVVEAKRNIPWTKPEDVPYSADQPLPELGGHFDGIFLAARADGSVQTMAKNLDETQLRRLLEKADGQPLARP